MSKPNYLAAGAGERMQYIAHKFNDTTIRFLLRYPGALDPDILCAATAAVIGAVDVLHGSFQAGSQSAHWTVNSEYEPGEFFSLAFCDGDPMKPAQGVAVLPIGHTDKCQMQVTLIQGPEDCAVVVRISHLVVDGGDGKYLLNKLAESYRMISQQGSAEALKVKNGSRSAMRAYSELGMGDMMNLIKMPFGGVKTDFPFADAGAHGPRRMLRCTIPEKTLTAARKKAKAGGATVNDLLLTACYRSYAAVTKREGPMSVSAMMDLRVHCKDGTSEGLANMSGVLTTTLEAGTGVSFAEDLSAIAAQTRAAKENPLAGLDGIPMTHVATKTVPMWLLLQVSDIVYSNMSLSLTNLGNIPCASLEMGGRKPTEGVFVGPLKRKPSVQVGAASFDGTAELTVAGDFVTGDLSSIQALLDGMKTEIETYLEETKCI